MPETPVKSQRPLVLIGDSAFAEVAFQYFTHDSPHEVVAFSVERAYMKRDMLFDRPIVPFEELSERYDPAHHAFFAALVYTDRNRLRTRLYESAKAQGFQPASYISKQAFVWPEAAVGEHCFIFEHNVVQPFTRIGNNVILWSGNHVGHHSSIGDHCFLASHVVVSGFVQVGEACFLGVNASIGNNVTIGAHSIIGAGALVLRDVPAGKTVAGVWRPPAEPPVEPPVST